jgi:hypothetical protein
LHNVSKSYYLIFYDSDFHLLVQGHNAAIKFHLQLSAYPIIQNIVIYINKTVVLIFFFKKFKNIHPNILYKILSWKLLIIYLHNSLINNKILCNTWALISYLAEPNASDFKFYNCPSCLMLNRVIPKIKASIILFSQSYKHMRK